MSLEVLLLLLVCMLDTLSSAWLFHHGLAVEANPLLSGFAEAGVLPFVAVKLLTFLPASIAAEWLRRRRPGLALPVVRAVTVAYLGIYMAAVVPQLLR